MRAIWPGALLSVYLGATLVVLLIGYARVDASAIGIHIALLAIVSAATWLAALPRWLRRWTPLLVLLFLYSELPALIRAAGHVTFFDAMIVDWEQLLFGAQPAQHWWSAMPWPAVSETLHLAYLSYYPIIFSVPALLHVAARDTEFNEALFALMVTFVVCFSTYIALPVAGPRYHWPWEGGSVGGPVRQLVVWLLEARSSRGTAFPSSHVAVAVTQSILAVRYFGVRGLHVAVLTVGLGAGAVYGGFHYAIDVFAGALTGLVTTTAALLLFRAKASRQRAGANAIAPT
jgi:membrane-associated phospholipid phosphatase